MRRRQSSFPVRLRYEFEAPQGRANALNRGILTTDAPVIAFIDDDVVVADRWLDEAVGPLLDAGRGIDYTWGPVQPIWEAPRPGWLSSTKADLWGAIAILDYGPDAFVFEGPTAGTTRSQHGRPTGAHRSHRRIQSTAGPLVGEQILGQEVPEFLSRAQAVVGRGQYVPGMLVRHHVPASRLTRRISARWWYGKGRSRAALERLQPVTELGVDLNRVPHLMRLPQFMWRSAGEAVGGWVSSALRFDEEARFRYETMLCYFAGYFSARREETSAKVR